MPPATSTTRNGRVQEATHLADGIGRGRGGALRLGELLQMHLHDGQLVGHQDEPLHQRYELRRWRGMRR